ncbi:MAG: NADH-quinone oxidoreductase subunit NuoE family protein [Gaiellaceae bacterium]
MKTLARFHREVAEIAAQYPESRSAVMPALRLAQEHHGGWLPAEAFVEVAGALDLTPAYVKGVATFYDMFHLEPVGRRLVEVCTNICCGLRGAQDVLGAFERELGVEPGETTDDGEFTLRAVECIGGCGWPTVVAIDNVHRLSVSAEDVPAIVQELRGD